MGKKIAFALLWTIALWTMFWALTQEPDADAADFRGKPVLICQILDKEPNDDGVLDAAIYLIGQGATAEQAGRTVAETVLIDCPRFVPVLDQYVKDNP